MSTAPGDTASTAPGDTASTTPGDTASTTPGDTASTARAAADPNDARLAHRAEGLLRWFNQAGVLDAAEVHIARRLGTLGAVDDEVVLLAAALAARAPRLGHVCVDLATIAETAGTEEGEAVPGLPWPAPEAWLAAVSASPLVGAGRPLQLHGTLCYLDRLHAAECRVAAALLERAGTPAGAVDEGALVAGLDRLFPTDDGGDDLPRRVAETAVRRRLAVIAGGPGTGKTTTVARILALLEHQARAGGGRPPLVALAAPTGKAAARLQEAVRGADVDPPLAGSADRWTASTLHRLLGTRPDSSTRFRHDETHPLVHDVVVVDEASMLSLSLMDRLLAAVRPDARLILLGDPQQLASVEAGVVLGDIVGSPTATAPDSAIAASVVVLQRIHRFRGAIAELAGAVRDGNGPRALELLAGGGGELTWIPQPADTAGSADLAGVRAEAVDAWRQVAARATAGDGPGALAGLGTFRVLCAHRHGAAGAAGWTEHIERWLAAAGVGGDRRGGWHAGQPLLVTVNDYDLRLFNGDTGVVVAERSGRLAAAFEQGGSVVALSPTRLSHVETCYAMTIHKAQGSQFDAVAVVLPDPASPILTRELLYTGITRARSAVTVVGAAESITAAIGRPVARASGLRPRLARPVQHDRPDT